MASLAGLGGAPKCPRCLKSVYFAEEAIARGQKWHKRCLTCGSCNKALESFTLNEHENDIYCKTCYTRNFAPKTAAPVSTG
ncbi:mlp-1 [Bugula neritina]|uniref:Mlp-1 n=1 Tax=Bugula neritina TaxID=10212 RepID=A0A7J7IY84_BUGNE|nr:mlp-1 [Bugula neritina]